MKIKIIRQVLWDSLKSTLAGALWKWLVGSASTLFGVLQFGKNFFETSLEKSLYIALAVFSVLFILRFCSFLFINTAKILHHKYRESVYGNAIILLRDSFSKVHQARKLKKIEDKDFMEIMTLFCNNLKMIFDKITGHNCSVSIKVPVRGPVQESTQVINLCRDSVATKVRDTNQYNDINHTIIGNTAYNKTVNSLLRGSKNKLYYLNNHVSATRDYDSTSRDVYENGVLPYQSEIVYPLIPYIWDAKLQNSECVGFLCVDSVNKNAFDEKYDVALVSGVADGIYDLITLRNKQKENGHE